MPPTTPDDIQHAYRWIVRQVHPNVLHTDEALHATMRLNEAMRQVQEDQSVLPATARGRGTWGNCAASGFQLDAWVPLATFKLPGHHSWGAVSGVTPLPSPRMGDLQQVSPAPGRHSGSLPAPFPLPQAPPPSAGSAGYPRPATAPPSASVWLFLSGGRLSCNTRWKWWPGEVVVPCAWHCHARALLLQTAA
jgi:hypothetical protein